MSNPSRDSIDEAYRSWREHGTPEAQKSLMEALRPQIDSALKSFAPGMENSLRLRAMSMAWKAVDGYDPRRGMHLKSYIYQQLQPLQREYGKRLNVVQMPERHILERKKLTQYEQDFESQNGRRPSVAELADFSNFSVERIETLRRGGTAVPESAAVLPESGDSTVSVKEDPRELVGRYVYSELDPTDQRIFEHVTGYGGADKLTKKDIAASLGISAPAVSQRINRITAKLQEGYNLEQ